jgi:two-component system, response regulator YesN
MTLKVLIVDDDHLVRKGIVSLMPWHAYGFDVVGEAENGEKALRFLENNQVDLIITDLAMPTMSGIELIRILCKRFPKLWIVVLTFHQDFEYVQEALRLGAIDYIAKIELENENMHEILRRISGRISDRIKDSYREVAPQPIVLTNQTKAVNVRMFIAIQSNDRPEFLKKLLSPQEYELLYEIYQNVWISHEFFAEEDLMRSMYKDLHLDGQWAVVNVIGINENNKNQLNKLLVKYYNGTFFYEYRKDKNVYVVNVDELSTESLTSSEEMLYEMKEQWSSLEWVYNRELFQRQIAQMEAIRPSLTKLETLFHSAVIHWERYTMMKLTPLFVPDHFKLWLDWLTWIDEMRSLIYNKFKQSQYSDEVMSGILKAADYINQNLSAELKLTEVAMYVHISRSYFSGCFHNIMGKTFNDYVRDTRLEFATVLLSQTNEPIYKIAEKCGYPDEKYFSKIFRAKLGKLPREFRKDMQERKIDKC